MGFHFGTLVSSRFLDLLVERGHLLPPAARRALDASEKSGTGVEKTLLELGLVPEDLLFQVLAEHLDLPFVGADELDIGLARGLALPTDFLHRVEIMPVLQDEHGICVATCDPQGGDAILSIGFRLNTPIRAALASPSAIKLALAALSAAPDDASGPGTSDADIERLRALANDGPVIKLVNDLIGKAVGAGASDIHIEAEESGARVRFRIDGVLHADQMIAEVSRATVVSRLKVMANLNISEKRRPQDGRVDLSVRGKAIDIRLSTLPTQFGESVVLRILDRSWMQLDWKALGFPAARSAEIERIVAAPNGIFLVAGPTGSGKTTTLYTALSMLNSEARKIVTVEDPIEYSLRGVNQVQVDPAIEMTFARALRSILRQDPDVIMVGEIRDQETAEIAVRAALVGRMVLSTIHTNDSIAAIDRLIDLGVPRYLLGATLRGVLSQRLVRRLCVDCGGGGCVSCGNSGRRGRVVVSEILKMTPEVVAAIAGRPGAQSLPEAAIACGFSALDQDGHRLVSQGVVSTEDLSRSLGIDWE
jgi:general secretion pathway protein E